MPLIVTIAFLALGSGDALAEQPAAAVSYNYPAQARAIPALRAWLDRQAASVRAQFQRDAMAEQREAAAEGRSSNGYRVDRDWKMVADGPRFFSLSLTRWEYTGGAHGNSEFGALVWDKAAKARLRPEAFFDMARLKAATRVAFCTQLDAERRTRRAREGVDDAFERCDAPFGVLILGSSARDRFDRVGFLIAPYEAGPYVEGTYEVTLPVTASVLAAVRPEYRPYFAIPRR